MSASASATISCRRKGTCWLGFFEAGLRAARTALALMRRRLATGFEAKALEHRNEQVRQRIVVLPIEAQMLASLVALRRAMRAYPIRHAVSFHSSIDRALLFCVHNEAFSQVFPRYAAIDTFHVSGSTPTGTRARLEALAGPLGLPGAEVAAWVAGFEYLQLMRLGVQAAGAAPALANRVELASLNEIDRRVLRETLRVARRLQQRLELDYLR